MEKQEFSLGEYLTGGCHFALAAEESAINICFSVSDPGITADADTEYIASYLFRSKDIIKNRKNESEADRR